ncbi:MAG: YhgE/Pip domain-containing protein, partial [Acidimicrobiales bacterium]
MAAMGAAAVLVATGLYVGLGRQAAARLSSSPIALVDQSHPVQVGQVVIDPAARLVETLRSRHRLDWVVTGAGGAAEGVRSGRFVAVVSIPASFGAGLLAVRGTPGPARLALAVGPSVHLLARRLVSAVRTELMASVGAAFVPGTARRIVLSVSPTPSPLARVLAGAASLGSGLDRAATGATQLAGGLSQSSAGASVLTSGVQRLATGASLAAGGARQLVQGASALDAGLATLARAVAGLPAGGSSLANGAHEVADGTAASAAGGAVVAAAVQRLASGAAKVHQLLVSYQATNPEAQVDPTFQGALRGEGEVTAGLAKLSAALAASVPKSRALAAGAADL